MVEVSPLHLYLQKYIVLNKEEEDLFVSKFSYKRVLRREILVEPGKVAQFRNFVVEGSLRTYVLGEDGEEHTVTFAIDEWWITDYPSFIFQKPATMFVVALEDSILLQISYIDEEFLKNVNPKFGTFFRKLAERSIAFMQRRIISNLSQNAETRYLEFLQNYPKVVQKVPQYALASYLGMSTEFLSKIRGRQGNRKK